MHNLLHECLSGVQTVAIGGHVRPDGDCVGSCCGLYHYMKENYPDIQTTVYTETIPDSYMQAAEGVNLSHETDPSKVYDLFIALDCGDRERLGDFAIIFDHAAKTLCIDHHISNQAFADANDIRPKASSTSEVLYDLMAEDGNISLKVAECLFMGIICDTGCFKHSNTLEHTMLIAGKLISKGVNTSKMMDEVFYEKTFMQNQLLGECLLRCSLELDGKCILCVVPLSLLDKYNAKSSDLEGVIDQMRITKGVEVAALITENSQGGCKLSMRACNYANVAEVAAYFGGGGHIRAAGATWGQSPEELVPQLLLKLKEQV